MRRIGKLAHNRFPYFMYRVPFIHSLQISMLVLPLPSVVFTIFILRHTAVEEQCRTINGIANPYAHVQCCSKHHLPGRILAKARAYAGIRYCVSIAFFQSFWLCLQVGFESVGTVELFINFSVIILSVLTTGCTFLNTSHFNKTRKRWCGRL